MKLSQSWTFTVRLNLALTRRRRMSCWNKPPKQNVTGSGQSENVVFVRRKGRGPIKTTLLICLSYKNLFCNRLYLTHEAVQNGAHKEYCFVVGFKTHRKNHGSTRLSVYRKRSLVTKFYFLLTNFLPAFILVGTKVGDVFFGQPGTVINSFAGDNVCVVVTCSDAVL